MSIIWLPTRKYKDKQTTKPGFEQKWYNPGPYNYVAVSIKRNYEDKELIKNLLLNLFYLMFPRMISLQLLSRGMVRNTTTMQIIGT